MNFLFIYLKLYPSKYSRIEFLTRIGLYTKMNECEKNEFLIGLKAQNTNLFLETRDQGRDAL